MSTFTDSEIDTLELPKEEEKKEKTQENIIAVSYTHLTLPTKDSV